MAFEKIVIALFVRLFIKKTAVNNRVKTQIIGGAGALSKKKLREIPRKEQTTETATDTTIIDLKRFVNR